MEKVGKENLCSWEEEENKDFGEQLEVPTIIRFSDHQIIQVLPSVCLESTLTLFLKEDSSEFHLSAV